MSRRLMCHAMRSGAALASTVPATETWRTGFASSAAVATAPNATARTSANAMPLTRHHVCFSRSSDSDFHRRARQIAGAIAPDYSPPSPPKV